MWEGLYVKARKGIHVLKTLLHGEKKYGIIPRKLAWFYPMQQSRYNIMNFKV